MNRTFRTKLLAIFGAAILSLVAVLALSAVMAVEQNRQLDDVQSRLVPKAELGPRIEAGLERLSRAMQDAVAAQDSAALEATVEQRTALFELINRGGAAIDPASGAALRWAIQDYYETAHAVSRRMIAGDSGESLMADVARMQAQQARATALVKKTTGLDRGELARAFASVRGANDSANRLRLGVTAVGVVLVAMLAFWGAKGVLQSLSDLSGGLRRFGKGDFAEPIPVNSRDELAEVASEANRMAKSLQELSRARDDDDWLKAGLAGLAEELRGELEPGVVAERALAFLAARVGALAGALYVREDDGSLLLQATHAGAALPGQANAASCFSEGQGLVGQAMASGELRLVDDLPEGYFKLQSGLGEAPPRQLLLLPLVHFARKAGVLELALLEPLSQNAREMLLTARATLGIPHLSFITVVDRQGYFELTYELMDFRGATVRVKTSIEGDEPVIGTVTGVYPTANWHEREAYDMFGVAFAGHPDLRRTYMWQDHFDHHPLLKSFEISTKRTFEGLR